ncbi:MAG: hypothetical protein LRY73_19240 [Bacillus sp. (in: Bacteria)]|nr:hypothetical protein [Bacillus sp. (in: firmicutes)]
MNNSQSQVNTNARRKIAVHNPYSSNTLHFKYPLLVAWWSLAFPGFGHFMVNSYLFGFFLMSVEFLLNNIAQINTAIYYSMIGDFEQGKEVINLKYFFVYIPLYIFTVWDSYRRGTELNQEFQLAYKDISQSIKPFQFSMFEVNPLRKKIQEWYSYGPYFFHQWYIYICTAWQRLYLPPFGG